MLLSTVYQRKLGIYMSIRGLILSVASESGLSLDEAALSLHEQIDNVVSAYKHECETYAAACDAVIADSPAVTKEALAPMVAMSLSKGNPAAFPETLKAVSEFVNITYVGKRGRRKEGDNSVRLSKRG